MRFCERCGRELSDDMAVCTECGRSQTSDPIINIDKRNGKGWPIMIVSMIAAGVGTFLLTYYFNFYFMLFFLPIFFFGRSHGERTTLDYVLMGGFIGLFVGYIIGIFVKFIPTFL